MHNQIIKLIKQDQLRIDALNCIDHLHLPNCYLAAGFIRNLVWDSLHKKQQPTVLNDIDVIYFDEFETDERMFLKYEMQLNKRMPLVNWQVRNQAKMHIRNGDRPYKNIIDAMSFWPEKETAIAIRKIDYNHYECISTFGFESLFNLNVTHNPKRNLSIFEDRVQSKNWLALWPMLTISK